jgi:excisionase family DNA binding protein
MDTLDPLRPVAPRLSTLDGAAAYAGVSRKSLSRLIRRQALPAVRLRGIRRILIDLPGLDRLIAQAKR